MKKLALLLVCLFSLQMAAFADDDKPVKVEQMPQTAQAFIKKHFATSSVAIAKVENDFFDKSYDVIFTDGNKVEFNKKGKWKNVDCRYSEVPAAILPPSISAYLKKNYPNEKVKKIEKEDRGGYEVKLANGWEISFDKKFNVIDLDR